MIFTRMNLITIALLFVFACNSDKTNKLEEETKQLPPKKLTETHPFKEAEYIYIYAHPWENFEDNSGKVKIVNDTVIYEADKEIAYVIEADKVKLGKEQIKELFDILYNYPCQDKISAECFDPRHTLAFYNKENKSFAQIQICLDCNNMNVDNGALIAFCENDKQKEDLRKYFKKVGVRYLGERKTQFQFFKKRYKEIMSGEKAVTE